MADESALRPDPRRWSTRLDRSPDSTVRGSACINLAYVPRRSFGIAPTIALGTNLGQRFFIRGSFWGPTTKTIVQSASAQATVWSLGGRLDAGLAFPVRRGTNLGGSAGLGLARYAIEGKPSLGFTPRAAGQVVFLGGLDVFWLQALTPRFYMELDLGVAVALPSVVIRINRLNAGERGFPEVHARFGFAYAF